MTAAVLYTAHGLRYNVRQEYDQLPWQVFWTWVTGKGRLLAAHELDQAMRPLSASRTLWHLVGSWQLIVAALWIGDRALASGSLALAVAGVVFCWLVVVNRGRTLQASFHYMTHGAAMPDRRWARRAATAAFSTPFLYQGWDAYSNSHVSTHHHMRVLCSPDDPDQLFIEENGLRPGMAERSFWWRVWFRPFAPAFVWHQLRDAWLASVVQPAWPEKAYRVAFLVGTTALAAQFDWLDRLLILFWLPVLVLLRHSLWLQLITEHLWFSPRLNDAGTPVAYGRLTWGGSRADRCLGAALRAGCTGGSRWWCSISRSGSTSIRRICPTTTTTIGFLWLRITPSPIYGAPARGSRAVSDRAARCGAFSRACAC
ncbi:hypothetical protein [Pseudorhodoferax sp. Leaf267]|uniref:hypothetical protein n=1 Tax=Pseudorhodoferax sp. Leaf267 TaxID=1736316 RepID=UPI0006FEA0EE|nr:hypothetical protein [Pseudorhodoferax sp. Leaf267]KQP20516.1 hypothetical protein ASF43_27175 [Pseudorhodoferax sp. Leaf267]